jgi:hypothetical protein
MSAIALLLFSLFAQDLIRTADITLRGLKLTDFPRVTKLADTVYAFEQIGPTKRTVTSLSIEPEDFELAPFNQRGGLGRAAQLLADLPTLLEELNEALAA